MKLLAFGSIGTLAETSHLQLDAFNRAFQTAGLDWHWTEEDYAAMLQVSGGKARIAAFATDRGETVDVDAIHAEKSRLFQQSLGAGVPLRDGVADALALARLEGWKLALVTTTSATNVDAVLQATALARQTFDLVLDSDHVAQSKPSPEAYLLTLERLEIAAPEAMAIEDNPDGLAAARAAGLACLALPGAMHDRSAFDGALDLQTRLDLSFLKETAR